MWDFSWTGVRLPSAPLYSKKTALNGGFLYLTSIIFFANKCVQDSGYISVDG